MTSPSRTSRSAGVLLIGAGVAASVLGLARPVAAADPVGPTAVTGVELDWAFSTYVGSATSASTSVSEARSAGAPATLDTSGTDPDQWHFPQGTGTFDPDTGATDIELPGHLQFGNTTRGNYSFRLADLHLVVDEAGEGRLEAEVAVREPFAPAFGAAQDVVVVTFDADPAVDGEAASFTATPDYPSQPPPSTWNQFPDSFLAAIPDDLEAHFKGTSDANNPLKAPAPITVDLTFGVPGTTTSTTPTTTATTPTTAAATTTSTSAPPSAVAPHGTATGTGPNGQTLTVTPTEDLDPAGETVQVSGSGFDPAVGVYVAFCVDNGPGTAPSPCVGGADQSGQSGSSRWITDSPPAPGISSPFGAGGTFATTLDLVADDGTVDCLDGVVRCVVTTRADHTRPTDRSADVKVPVYFVGQAPPTGPGATPPPAVLDRTTVPAGGQITVSGAGFLAGEQVQVVLHSDPIVLGVVLADGAGAVSTTEAIPAGTPPGTHHIELVGVTSGTTVASPPFTVTAAAAAGVGGTGGTALPRTGGEGPHLALVGLLCIAAGTVMTSCTRRAGAAQA